MPETHSAANKATSRRLADMAMGFAPAMMIYAAAQNRVFDSLDEGRKAIPQLAAATGTNERALRYLLECLLSYKIVCREQDHFFLAPDAAAFLVRGKPGYLGNMAELARNWVLLPEIVRTGRPVAAINSQTGGAEYFRSIVDHLHLSHAIGAKSFADALAVQWPLAATDARVNVLDVAAGSGVWGIAVAKRLPQAHLTAVDWPAVVPVTRRYAEAGGVGDRFHAIEGDVLEVDFGAGYHLAILGHILHSEGEERSRQLLKKVYNALAPGGIVAIFEFVPRDDRSGPAYPLLFALHLLIHSEQGDTFSAGQMSKWLTECGFVSINVVSFIGDNESALTAIKP